MIPVEQALILVKRVYVLARDNANLDVRISVCASQVKAVDGLLTSYDDYIPKHVEGIFSNVQTCLEQMTRKLERVVRKRKKICGKCNLKADDDIEDLDALTEQLHRSVQMMMGARDGPRPSEQIELKEAREFWIKHFGRETMEVAVGTLCGALGSEYGKNAGNRVKRNIDYIDDDHNGQINVYEFNMYTREYQHNWNSNAALPPLPPKERTPPAPVAAAPPPAAAPAPKPQINSPFKVGQTVKFRNSQSHVWLRGVVETLQPLACKRDMDGKVMPWRFVENDCPFELGQRVRFRNRATHTWQFGSIAQTHPSVKARRDRDGKAFPFSIIERVDGPAQPNPVGSGSRPPMDGRTQSGRWPGGQWTCPMCTLHNHGADDKCGVCGAPRPRA